MWGARNPAGRGRDGEVRSFGAPARLSDAVQLRSAGIGSLLLCISAATEAGEPGGPRIETARTKKGGKKLYNDISLIIREFCRNAVAGEEFLKMVVDRKRGPGLYHRHRRRVRGAQIAVLQNSDLSLDRVKPDEWLSSCLAIETEKEKRGRRSSCGFIER
jgi:hypothetical protein